MFTPHNLSRVTCHVSPVTCHLSHVTCFLLFVFFDKIVELVSGGSVINGAYPVQFLTCWRTDILCKRRQMASSICFKPCLVKNGNIIRIYILYCRTHRQFLTQNMINCNIRVHIFNVSAHFLTLNAITQSVDNLRILYLSQ